MGRLRFDGQLRYDSGFRLDAAFEAGDGVTALFGPSGSGKSTTLALIAGVLRPQSGSIRLGERTLVDVAAGVFVPPERRRLGVVFQDQRLFPHLTVRQNLRFGTGRGGRGTPDFARVAEVLELGPLLDRRPAALSGGQRQRVALGRALLCGPELLLLDEPLTALDEELKHRIISYLERVLSEWRVPTLFVSHDQADVRRLAERVVVVEGGRVVAAGHPDETLAVGGPVNLLRITDLRKVGDYWEGRIGTQSLRLPSPPSHADAAVFARFLPGEVELTRPEAAALPGVVCEVANLPDRTLVAVDVGQVLWVEVAHEVARELDLRPGVAVGCRLPVRSVTLVEPVGTAAVTQ